MPGLEISIVVGNPKAKSRTRDVAEGVAARLADVTGAQVSRTVELSDHASRLFEWEDAALDELTAQVAASTFVIFASPTYKAAYTGLLKAFLDRYDTDGLAGVTAIAVMTGGSPTHSLAVDQTLRPLLAELGASLPTRGMYFVMSEFDDLNSVLDEWASQHLESPGLLGPMRRP